MAKMTIEEYKKALVNPWAFVRREIKLQGLDSIELARGTGIPRPTIRSYLNGTRVSPRIPQLNRMLRYVLKRKIERVPTTKKNK